MVGQARAFVCEHAPPLPEDTADTLQLLTSELVTNAVLHARSAIEVGITVGLVSVLVTVHDEDLPHAEQRPYAQREGGWGLGLVRALAEEWAMELHPGDGKTVWFRLLREGGVPAAPGSARRAEPDGAAAARAWPPPATS